MVMPLSTIPNGGSVVYNYGPATGVITITITETGIPTATATATATSSMSGSDGGSISTKVVTVSTVVSPIPGIYIYSRSLY
ncbi:hypothetical protein N7528_001042 [Penicillium herquei]|nr:hypothetical protein N7528_001042 [Penicillium herquei]